MMEATEKLSGNTIIIINFLVIFLSTVLFLILIIIKETGFRLSIIVTQSILNVRFFVVLRFDEVPSEFRSQRDDYHHELVEHLANSDDQIGELFLEEKTPTEEEVHAAIRRWVYKLD